MSPEEEAEKAKEQAILKQVQNPIITGDNEDEII